MLRIADIRNRHYAHDRDTCSSRRIFRAETQTLARAWLWVTEWRSLTENLTEKSLCYWGDRTCWKFTLWNLSEIYLLDIYVKLAENLPAFFILLETCLLELAKICPLGSGESYSWRSISLQALYLQITQIGMLGAGCYQLPCTGGINWQNPLHRSSWTLAKLSGLQKQNIKVIWSERACREGIWELEADSFPPVIPL